MELHTVKKENDKTIIVLKVGESEFTEVEGIKPKLINLNEVIFDTKENAVKYFESVNKHNNLVIEDNKKRLEQLDENSLEKINDFVEVVKKTKAIGTKKCKKIDELIQAHENMRGFQFNIKATEEKNKINLEIIDAVGKLE